MFARLQGHRDFGQIPVDQECCVLRDLRILSGRSEELRLELHLFQASCRELSGLPNRGAGRLVAVIWSHLYPTILLCFLREWHARLAVWQLLLLERLGGLAPVQVCDQTIYNGIERVGTHLRRLCGYISIWL